MVTQDMLLEIGVEELPASFLDQALEAIRGLLSAQLESARLGHGAIRPLGTPRRLGFIAEGVAVRQDDLSEEVVGPPKRVAMGDDGELTKAGRGFAKKQGVLPEALRVVTTDKGEYVAFTREETGRAAVDVLPGVLAELCKKIPFRKSMRWGPGEIAFGRPIHWLLCLHGDDVVPVTFAGVTGGRKTRGHRFLSPEELEVPTAGAYVDALREAHVYVDPKERRDKMTAALGAAADAVGGAVKEDAFLVGECAGMVEEPFVVPGSFDPAFLKLPPSVIVSVMRDHQRYFAVVDDKGALLPRYLNVVNTANEPEVIARGNDRVLRARLDDARFFIEQDQLVPLADQVPRLDDVVFQKKLGSIGDKMRRVGTLAAALTDRVDSEVLEEAAGLSKADLVTNIVGEFPELQGEMGSFYYRASKTPTRPEIETAIYEHYLPRGAGDDVPKTEAGAALGVADRADTLVGCFGIGLVPTGSADPFALRRAAFGIVRTALEGPADVKIGTMLRRAYAGYVDNAQVKPADEVVLALEDFFRARLKSFYSEQYPTDLVQACLGAWDGESVRDLNARIAAVAAFRRLPEYESLAIAFKRAFNIAKDAPDGDPDPALFTEDAEKALAGAFSELRSTVDESITKGAYDEALGAVARDLRAPIDRFFEEVMVMVDDDKVRDNRLRLLGGIARTLTGIAHFHELST